MRRPWIAWPTATLELGTAVVLATPWWRTGAWLAFGLAALFGVAFATIVARGLPADACGCFGSWRAPVGAHFGIIMGLLVLARQLTCAERGASTGSARAPRRRGGGSSGLPGI